MGLIQIDSKIANQRFFQQNLKHCIPLLHPGILIIIFAILGVFLLIFGGIFAAQAPDLLFQEFEHKNGVSPQHSFKLNKKILHKENVYIYYMLPKFYQNVRSYVQSFDLAQISGDKPFKAAGFDDLCVKTADPAKIVDEPCGLIFKTRVTDKYEFFFSNGTPITLKHDVAWPSDVKQNTLFGKTFKAWKDDVNGWDWQMLSVWMRPAPFPDVQKIYGYIPKETVAKLIDEATTDEIEIKLTAAGTHGKDVIYSKSRFVRIQQTSAIGGKQETMALSIICLVVGFICAAAALIFAILMVVIGPRSKKYDVPAIVGGQKGVIIDQKGAKEVELQKVKSD